MNQANCFIYSVHYALQYGSMVRIVSDCFQYSASTRNEQIGLCRILANTL